MTLILAILGLSFLVFIHELGHYLMAKKVGMKVEVFSIGFGPKFFSWHKNGVEWRLCYLPFGGYVKIAGMQQEGNKDLREVEGGYFAHSPWDRIKVAFMGPFVNLLFAFVVFTALWVFGGKKQPFGSLTHKVGWVEPSSSLYEYGLRPGDEVLTVNKSPVKGYQDFVTKLFTKKNVNLAGFKIDYNEAEKETFNYRISFKEPKTGNEITEKLKLLSPASYLIYHKPVHDKLPQPMQPNDRLFWLNGEYLFSITQLAHLLNEDAVFVTAERNGYIFHSKLPTAKVEDLSLSRWDKAELDDWKHEAGLQQPLNDLYFLPYLLNVDNEVLSRINFIDEQDQQKAFVVCERCPYFHPLERGDKVLAVDGIPTKHSFDLLHHLQEKRALMIVQRDPSLQKTISWKEADQHFDDHFAVTSVEKIVESIGTPNPMQENGTYHLLSPFTPPTAKQLAGFLPEYQNYKENSVMLGVLIHDQQVRYNPNPFSMFGDVFELIYRNLSALVTGQIPAKYMAGPVGIIQVVQHSWMQGFKEAIFWLGLISINLAILNLLPIPVLDGGYILFSLYELITKKRLTPKAMERMILPFMVLLVGFLLYVTYHDIMRIFTGFL